MSIADGWPLIVGYGSIGRRYYQNLQSLGFDDVRLVRSPAPRASALESPATAQVYHDLQQALAAGPSLVIVSNPTSLHVETARTALQADLPVILEKPVSHSASTARELLQWAGEKNARCSVAYCFRYHPLYRQLRESVQAGAIGRPFHVHSWQASFLPDWHPWEDYRGSYAARAELGGGVVRTLDHDLDFLRWSFGQPESVIASAGPLSGINVPVDDTADMIYRFPSRLQACVHLSFARRDYARGVWVVGEEGTLVLDWNQAALQLVRGKVSETIEALPDDFDLNSIYVETLRDAIRHFDEGSVAIPLADGVAALEMAIGALQSSENGQMVDLGRIHE